MKDQALDIIKKLIDEHKINGDEAVVLISAINNYSQTIMQPVIQPAPFGKFPDIVYCKDHELNDRVTDNTSNTIVYG